MQDKDIIPVDTYLPPKLFVIPLMGRPIFPGLFTPIMIENKDDIKVVEEAISGDSYIGLLAFKQDEETGHPHADDLYKVGTVAKIIKKINLPNGGINIFVSTLKRFSVTKYISHESPIVGAVQYHDDITDDSTEIKALTRAVISEMKALSENNPLFSEEMRLNMVNIDHPGKIADFIAYTLNIKPEEQQDILETYDVKDRIGKILIFIKQEMELLRIQKKIQNQINDKIEKSQREYFLREELKAIKKELGMPTDAKSGEYQRFIDALEKLDLQGEAKEQVKQELEKFTLMDPNSSEFIVTRNYLDTIINLPWGVPEAKDFDIQKAQKILNTDHYGLEDVKERILEYLAVRKLKKDMKGSIICLVGPPGVGKTSIGKSIARSLNKEFFRFSVGGMRDEAEIKGHRRTYVGAMPGKIIQGLKIVKSADPVFMIDEIDKMGASYHGDPSSALLEVLDPEQNINFRDNYLDLPFDISSILFIATANTLDSIPRPLLDRMEIIRLSGYIEKEKVEIAKRYLIPKSLAKHGFKKTDIKIPAKSLASIATGYAREAGVRNLEKAIDKIHRKLAKKMVLDDLTIPFSVDAEQLSELLGQPVWREDEDKHVDQPGMVTGLAWTNFGGDTLIIEAIDIPGKNGFKLTGQMGNVMQESASISYSYIRHIADRFGIQKDYFDKNTIHIHIPAGATPKDGPSAGISMALALLSLVTQKKVKAKLAMTGELSLVGKVLPIGGLKEKTIAARRQGIKHIIIPKQNEKDLEEIPDYIKKGLSFYPVATFDEVFKIALPSLKTLEVPKK